MASYTYTQLYGTGSIGETISSGVEKVFTFTNPGGSSYFTMETIPTSKGVFEASSPKNFSGSFVVSASMGLVTSSYIASVVVQPGTQSFKFTPAITVEGTTYYLKGTGMYSLNIASTAAVPVNTGAPVISGNDYVTSVLTTTNGTWTNTPTNFSYQWYRGATEIGGATSNTYTLVQADADFEVKCRVIAGNASGTSDPAYGHLIYVYDFNYNEVYTSGYGTSPSLAVSKLQNKLLIDLKTAGVWEKLDSLFVFAGDGDIDFAIIDWKRLSQGTNNGTTYTSRGITGGGSGVYFDTNFNPTIPGHLNYFQNKASRYAYVTDFGTNPTELSIIDGLDGNSRNTIQIGNTAAQRINQNGDLSATFNYNTTSKMKSIHRTTATDVTLFNDTSGTTKTAASSALVNASQVIFLSNASYSEGGTIGLYAMGNDMVGENTDFVNAVNTYMSYF
jgi:hypothetical protein